MHHQGIEPVWQSNALISQLQPHEALQPNNLLVCIEEPYLLQEEGVPENNKDQLNRDQKFQFTSFLCVVCIFISLTLSSHSYLVSMPHDDAAECLRDALLSIAQQQSTWGVRGEVVRYLWRTTPSIA